MALGQWILHREVQKAMGTLGTHHRSSPEQPKLLQRQHQLSNGQKLQICKNAAVQQQSEPKAHNLLNPTTQKGLSESSSEHNCSLFMDIKAYLSPAVSTTVKGVHTAGLLHLYTDYINSHIVTESKKRTIS